MINKCIVCGNDFEAIKSTKIESLNIREIIQI